MNFGDIYAGKTVMVTGHTGFKGSWLCEWLCMLGATVVGYSLPAEQDPCHTTPSHFTELGLRYRISTHIESDIRDLNKVEKAIAEHKPDFIFHLAAQPIVIRSFYEPYMTINTILNGTLNILESVRRQKMPCVLVIITTDKTYKNVGWVHSYREPDKLGGHDPYSASKACVELVVSSYWKSFFAPNEDALGDFAVGMAPVRGGNVIGGGDWAENRIVPDAIRALASGEPLIIRNGHATRPWQHVLELLSGYLHLGRLIHHRRAALLAELDNEWQDGLHKLKDVCSPFNFGPLITSNKTVSALVEEIIKYWPGSFINQTATDAPLEASKLNLTIDKAYHLLGWQPKWGFEETILQTVGWYRHFYHYAQGDTDAVIKITQNQIQTYSKDLEYRINQ
jgi:CDP-glucose 4,6-dehydratase